MFARSPVAHTLWVSWSFDLNLSLLEEELGGVESLWNVTTNGSLAMPQGNGHTESSNSSPWNVCQGTKSFYLLWEHHGLSF